MAEVLIGNMMVPIGTAEITNLGQLSPTRSIVGFFPIISPTEEKIGDLHVNLVMESLMGRLTLKACHKFSFHSFDLVLQDKCSNRRPGKMS